MSKIVLSILTLVLACGMSFAEEVAPKKDPVAPAKVEEAKKASATAAATKPATAAVVVPATVAPVK